MDTLARLDAMLHPSDRMVIAVVSGMGGLGKTTLAVEYARRHQANFPGGVCWLKGRTGDLATQVLLKAEVDLKLPGLDAAKEKLVETAEIVQWCWRHWPAAGPVLIVVDDVTDWAKVRSLLPTDDRFRVLVTTRRRDLVPSATTIPLEVLQPTEALALLKRLDKAGQVEREPKQAELLCEELGYLPLGIELVGCYLARDRHRTLMQVIKSLQAKKGMQDPALVPTEGEEMLAERGVKAAFDLTWETLVPEARQVARLLSYFALDWIAWDVAEWMMQRVEGEAYALGGLKAQLENASLVAFDPDVAGLCWLHPLIRQYLSAAEALAVQQSGAAPLRDAFASVMVNIASGMPDNPPTAEIKKFEWVRSHVQEVADSHTTELVGDDLVWPFVALARFYAGQGLYRQAEEWYVQCLRVTESRFEGDHPAVATSLNNLALLYDSQGRLGEAEPLYVRSLEMTQRLFEGDHPAVATSLNNLALLYKSQGRMGEAEPLLVRSLEMRQRLFEGDHPDVATSLNNLAALYKSQGRMGEAEPLLVRSLEMRQRLFEGDHPDVASSLNNLAYLYDSQGRLSEAEPLFVRSLEMYQTVLGSQHPNTQTVLGNLQNLREQLGSAPRRSAFSNLFSRLLPWLNKRTR